MRPNKYSLILIGVGALVMFTAQPSQAQIFGLGGNLTGLPYNYFQSQQELPFYAKFPPVYYSYPVARPYGWSPFAYPPGILTPDPLANQQPLEIVNPYVEPSKPQPSGELPAPSSNSRPKNGAAGFASSRAKVIVNPHATNADGSAQLTVH